MEKEETAVASIVPSVGMLKKAVPNVKRVVRGRLVLGVKLACRGNTVRVTSMLLAAHSAPLDLVKTIQDRRRAYHAAPADSPMSLVLWNANNVLKTRTTAKKEEIRRALVVQQVGLRRKAVPNVPRAVRVDLAVGAKIVHWVMPEQETTMMQRNVNNVNWVKQQRLKGQLIVMLAMLENLVKPKVFVRNARRVFIKTTKVKTNVSNAK